MAIQVNYDVPQPVTAEGSPATDPIQPPPLSADPEVLAYFAANPQTQWFSAGYLEAEYTFYAINTIYQTDLGLQAAPATAPRATVISSTGGPRTLPPPDGPDQNTIVRVRRPITLKIVSWTAQRLGVKPILPHWKTGNDNEKLLSRTISARNPLQSVNHKIWEVSGQYVYAFKKEPFITVDETEYFVLPASMTAADNVSLGIPLHAYSQGDFTFASLDTAWIPVDRPLDPERLPIGYSGRTAVPDPPNRATAGNQRQGLS